MPYLITADKLARLDLGEKRSSVITDNDRAMNVFAVVVTDRDGQDRSLVVSAPDRGTALRLWAGFHWADVVGDIEPAIADGFIPDLVAGWDGRIMTAVATTGPRIHDGRDDEIDEDDIASAFLGAGLELLAHA